MFIIRRQNISSEDIVQFRGDFLGAMNVPATTAAASRITHRPLTDASDSLMSGAMTNAPSSQSSNVTIDWLTTALAREEARRRLTGTPAEEREMLLMRRPIETRKAFARFGMLLGLLPPAAIFWRMSGGEMFFARSDFGWLILFLAMNIVCCLVGRAMGSQVGKHIDDLERDSWSLMLLVAAGLGLWWAIVTGAAGGVLAFGVGAIFGIVFAAPVGLLAFMLFTPLHRSLARGGMIDARHFWPLAFGIVGTITALILSLK